LSLFNWLCRPPPPFFTYAATRIIKATMYNNAPKRPAVVAVVEESGSRDHGRRHYGTRFGFSEAIVRKIAPSFVPGRGGIRRRARVARDCQSKAGHRNP
jgi:hypothetical protein